MNPEENAVDPFEILRDITDNGSDELMTTGPPPNFQCRRKGLATIATSSSTDHIFVPGVCASRGLSFLGG
jgi:hypothetical protein